MSLYLGFTLMSLLEAIVFFSVAHVRKVVHQLDEESQLARKNPPIRKITALIRLRALVRRVTTQNRVVKAFAQRK
jgi:type II secretory pathway component PulJ